jgi:hypothetical protein
VKKIHPDLCRIRPSNSRHDYRLDERSLLAEQCINIPGHAMHYACVRPLRFSRARRAMGVSSNQRPIRVVHASRGLPNAVFNRNYDASVHVKARAFLPSRRGGETNVGGVGYSIPVRSLIPAERGRERKRCRVLPFPLPALNKRDSNSRSQGRGVRRKKASRGREDKLFTRRGTKMMYTRVWERRGVFRVKLNGRARTLITYAPH